MEYILTCPYCKNEQLYALAEEEFQRLLCYPEHGGCDEYFAVSVRLVPEVVMYELKAVDEKVSIDW